VSDQAGTAPALSLVIPVYNEEGNVAPLFGELTRVATALGRPYEIVFVNDGSQDATLERLKALKASDPHLRVVDLDGNFGEAAALSAGFSQVRGEIVVTLDGDGQNDPADIPRLLAKLDEGYDVVSGRRSERKERFLTRVLPSRVANWLIAKATGVPVYDCGCGLKVYRRKVLNNVQIPRGFNRFLPAILGMGPERVAEVVVNDRARGSGASHYGLSRIFVVLKDLPSLPFLVRQARGARVPAVALGIGSALLVGVAALVTMSGVPRYQLPAATVILFCALANLAVMPNYSRFVAGQRRGVFRVREVL
jgi:glycosyltransferase involved in cell wall biosynthesis